MKHWEKYTIEAKCERCGRIFKSYTYNLKRGWGKFCSIGCSKIANRNRFGKSLSDVSRKKISETLSKRMKSGEIKSPLIEWYNQKPRFGEDSPNWRGGKCEIGQEIRKGLKYKKWRKLVFEKDNYICQMCGIRNHKGLGRTIKFEAHHVKSFSEFPDLRFSVNNGQTLCAICHNKIKKGRPKINRGNNFENIRN